MFTKNDYKRIDRKHFEVLMTTAYYLELKSKDTGHTWSIYFCQWETNRSSLVVRHKHNDKDAYHIQAGFHPRTIKQAQAMIKQHDSWHLSGRKREWQNQCS